MRRSAPKLFIVKIAISRKCIEPGFVCGLRRGIRYRLMIIAA